MICDSTNVFNENPSGSESEVREVFREIFLKNKKGKIMLPVLFKYCKTRNNFKSF